MKRTKETFFTSQPHFSEREGLSGCKEFDGEDLTFDSRVQYNKTQQKEWIEQQKNEKDMELQRQKFEEDLYAKQVHEINRMRQMLEEDQKRKKQSIQSSLKDENLILAQQKRDRELKEKQDRLREEREEVNLLQERGRSQQFKTAC